MHTSQPTFLRRVSTVVQTIALVAVMALVASPFAGCEEEPTRPESCGAGPFERDSKSGVCKRVSTGAVVDSACCDF